jgi:hypothetical protein
MTFEDLFNFESAIETAACAILGETAWHEFSDKVATGPLIGYEVKFAGTPTGVQRQWKSIKLPVEYRGTLEVRVVTTRFQNSDKHAALLTQARVSFLQALYLFNDTNLPYHWVTYVAEQSAVRGHDQENGGNGGIDHTTLRFELVVSIRDECWLDE